MKGIIILTSIAVLILTGLFFQMDENEKKLYVVIIISITLLFSGIMLLFWYIANRWICEDQDHIEETIDDV